jgi:hypothetical protein
LLSFLAAVDAAEVDTVDVVDANELAVDASEGAVSEMDEAVEVGGALELVGVDVALVAVDGVNADAVLVEVAVVV